MSGCEIKHNIITISGALGSGKYTIMKMLANRLGYETYSTGNAQRQIAQKYGVLCNLSKGLVLVFNSKTLVMMFRRGLHG